MHELMRERLESLHKGLDKAKKAPLMAKAHHAELMIEQALELMEVMIERIEHLELVTTQTDPEKLEKIRKLEREYYGG